MAVMLSFSNGWPTRSNYLTIIGDTREHLGPEQLKRTHNLIVRRQAIIHPGEEPFEREPFEQSLELPRDRIDRADQCQAILEEIRHLMRFGIFHPFREAERLLLFSSPRKP